MSKSKKTATPETKTTAAATTPAAAKTIAVAKTAEKYSGARAAWYAALLEHNGQTNDAFIAACMKKPPSVPASGKTEDPRGWLKWFVRNGVATLS